MKQSQLFTKTQKEIPKDEVSRNAELLIRAGFVHKEMAGAYAYLPLGLQVQNCIKKIVQEEMNAISCQEIIMTSLQRKELWEKTDRWDDEKVDIWFKTSLHAGGDVGLAWSHEEPIGDMIKNHIASYKDLPVYVYQFQTKLRNELRAKSGIMRGREFVMKDAYTFCADEEQHNAIYDAMKVAYTNVFDRLGVGSDTFITFASGGAFTEFSHEFQTVCPAGEDVCYINREKNIAINEEVLNDETLEKLGVTQDELEKVATAEVGNIFNFRRQKADDLDLRFTTQDGKQLAVWMGSYGIGITRLMGVIVEKFSDDRGIMWPKSITPYHVHLLNLKKDTAEADAVYETLQNSGFSVLYDDRDIGAGEKFAEADLIGISVRLVISDKTEGKVEWKERDQSDMSLIDASALLDTLDTFYSS